MFANKVEPKSLQALNAHLNFRNTVGGVTIKSHQQEADRQIQNMENS